MKKLILNILVICCIGSCGSKENPYDREQKEIDKEISSSELQVYKSFKVALRGTAQAGKDPAFDEARMQVLSAMAYTLGGMSDSTSSANPMILIQTSSSLVSAVSLLSKTDEDSLPTILDNIFFVMKADSQTKTVPLEWLPNESEEHGILSVIWLGTPSAPSSLTLYELSRTDESELRSVDVKIISKMTRSIFYMQHKWPYHSEKSADELISLVEKEKDYLLKNPWPMMDANGNSVTPIQAWHQLYALSFAMRARARMEMEEKDAETISDLESFVEEAEQGGFDNEAVWSAGAYVAIKKEDKEKSLLYLGKLEKSKTLSKDELDAVKDIKEYVEKKDNDEAMSAIKDKIAFVKIVSNYFGNIARNSKPIASLNSSEAGRQFLRIGDISFNDIISGASNTLDSALNKTKSKLKDIF